jgi:hypothetical protein
LGSDVIDLKCLISSLSNCGPQEPTWPVLYAPHINEFGLFDDDQAAQNYAIARSPIFPASLLQR